VVECGFGPVRIKQELQALGYQTAAAPLGAFALESIVAMPVTSSTVRGAATPSSMSSITPPRFDNKMLTEISMAAVTLKCECPHHLSDLLVRLGNFEAYSAECENDSPADATLHQYLKKVAGAARVLLEGALVRVAELEGIALRSI
jgi:hypothetical protein